MNKDRCTKCGGLFWHHNEEWLCSQCGRPRASARPVVPLTPDKREPKSWRDR